MRHVLLLAGALLVLLALPVQAQDVKIAETYGAGPTAFSLATGSPGELGLLKALAEPFCAARGAALHWVKAGSGESLQLLKDGKVDMIMVHAPAAEKKAVQEGWAAGRTLIGSNEFFIVGPEADPAGIKAAKSAAEAYQKIAAARATFFSRGDNSGTHKKELDAWKNAGVEPSGDWYVVTKDFMTATLKRANAEGGYFMTDSSTWAAEKKNLPHLRLLFRGDVFLVNTYNALAQSEARPEGATPGAAMARKFIDFVAGPEGQRIIAAFGAAEHGEGLYNDAAYAKPYDR